MKSIAEFCSNVLELFGVLLVTLLALYSTVNVLILRAKGAGGEDMFKAYRQEITRGVLLGLEFLVAADIIRTVAVELTFTSVGVLAIIVLIRTFLSVSLEMEMTGRWPWQQNR